ncbi:MAG: hypothetical protein Q7T38_07705 [Gallionella sp.]|nr:hypothetical protein [Gallionella sp.]
MIKMHASDYFGAWLHFNVSGRHGVDQIVIVTPTDESSWPPLTILPDKNSPGRGREIYPDS